MNFAKDQSKPISELSYSPLELTRVKYTDSPRTPAPIRGNWEVRRIGTKVHLKYCGGETTGRDLQVTVKIGGHPVVTDAHIV